MSQKIWTEINGSGENYRAYLLRCWQEKELEPDGQSAWRFTLVKVGSNRARRGFAFLEDLMNYLHEELTKTEHTDSEGE